MHTHGNYLNSQIHCPKDNLNRCIKTKPITVRVDATVSGPKAGQMTLHPLQLQYDRFGFLCEKLGLFLVQCVFCILPPKKENYICGNLSESAATGRSLNMHATMVHIFKTACYIEKGFIQKRRSSLSLFWTRTIWRIGSSSFSLYCSILVQFILFFVSSWCNSYFSFYHPRGKQLAGKELNKFCPPNSSDDLCLLFCIYPFSMVW